MPILLSNTEILQEDIIHFSNCLKHGICILMLKCNFLHLNIHCPEYDYFIGYGNKDILIVKI